MGQRPITDEHIRQFILGDELLYSEAREYGCKRYQGPEKGTPDDPLPAGDDCMYQFLHDFIDQNRKRLKDTIRQRLQGHTAHA